MTTADLPQSVAIARPDPALIDSADRYLASATASYAVIKTGDEFEAAAIDLQAVKSAQKRLEADRTSISGPINAALKALNALFKKPAEALERAESIIKRGMIGYQNEQERIRREAEAKMAEQLRKDREKLEAQAAKAVAKGNVERAEALQASAAALPTTVEIASAAPKVAGISGRSTWQAAVKDKVALVEGVAGGRRKSQRPHEGQERRLQQRTPMMAVDANMVFLNQQARSMKSTLYYPGVEAVEVQGIAARAA